MIDFILLKFTELFGGLYACLSTPHLGMFLHYFFKQSLCSFLSLLGFPSNTHLICFLLTSATVISVFISVSSNLFHLIISLTISCHIFKLTDSSAYSNLLLDPSSQFYFSYYIFKLQNLFFAKLLLGFLIFIKIVCVQTSVL